MFNKWKNYHVVEMLRFKTSISSTPTISLFGLFIVYKYNTRFVSVEETKEGVRLTRRREEGKKRGGGARRRKK